MHKPQADNALLVVINNSHVGHNWISNAGFGSSMLLIELVCLQPLSHYNFYDPVAYSTETAKTWSRLVVCRCL